MRLALLSDIHANLHALEAVWADLEQQAPDSVICLGDLVGYGAHPNEVIDFIRARAIPTVMGNYDDGVGFDLDDCGCLYKTAEDIRRGKQALLIAQAMTAPDRKVFLRGLPLQLRMTFAGRACLFVHGSPRKINEYLYEDRPLATFERLAKLADCDVLCFGHTHLPYQKKVGRTLFLNTGAVGKPKDGDPRAGYVLIDFGPSLSITFRRVTYAVSAAAEAMRAAGLPSHFAALLETGGLTPSLKGVAS